MYVDIDEQVNEGTLFLEPRKHYDDCIIGISYEGNQLIYDSNKIMDVLMQKDEMTEDEALEFFEYNILGSYVGESTPIYVVNLKFDTFDILTGDKNVN
jgi:hypothetical protein